MTSALVSPPNNRHDPYEGVGVGGFITTGARRDRVPAEFEPLMKEAIKRVAAIPGRHSLYVYGSVATGMAKAGSSDVDLVTIGLEREIALRLGEELSARYRKLCRGVEIGPSQLSDYEGLGDEVYGNRVFLRHYCVHLAGPDVRLGLPDFQADAAAARGFNGDIGLCVAQWRAAALCEPYVASLGRRVARKTLFAVAGLVSVHDSTWTTDRVAAARRWGTIKADLAVGLRELVGWATLTSAEPQQSEVQIQLDEIVADIVDDFRRGIGLWAQQQRRGGAEK